MVRGSAARRWVGQQRVVRVDHAAAEVLRVARIAGKDLNMEDAEVGDPGANRGGGAKVRLDVVGAGRGVALVADAMGKDKCDRTGQMGCRH